MSLVSHPELRVFPVRTPTLPPATHTNCYVLGAQALTIVDPASPWEEEQEALALALDTLCAGGARVERVLLTHHHGDHVGGAQALAARYGVPILAHARTAERLRGHVAVQQIVEEGEVLRTDHGAWVALHTPGHASGHLCLWDPAQRAVVAGDMVAGVGTIVLEPPEGVLAQYLDSLERLRALGAAVLFPAHGPDLRDPEAVLGHYIQHRHQRTAQVRAALGDGAASPEELVERVYGDTIPRFIYPVAAAQVRCHLAWLAERGEVRDEGARWALSC